MTHVSFGQDGDLWTLDSACVIWRFSRSGSYIHEPGCATEIPVQNASTIWAIGIYQNGTDQYYWNTRGW